MIKIFKDLEILILIAMIYLAIDLSSMVFAYKIVNVGGVLLAASSLIFPLTYSIMDIVAEVYGYQVAKKIVLYGFICDVIFAALVVLICHIPSFDNSQTYAYTLVLGSLLRAVFAQMIGVLCGALVNIYILSKWKSITNGRYFWLRSIGSSCIGEAVMLVISVVIALGGVLAGTQLLQLIFVTYIYKVIFAIVISPFISFIATLMKRFGEDKKYFLNVDSFGTPYNPDFSPNFQK